MSVSWLRELPETAYALEDPPPEGQLGVCVIDRHWFERLDEYCWGYPWPTAPSAGRVYRRNVPRFDPDAVDDVGEPDAPPLVFVVRDEIGPDGKPTGYQLHHPHEVILV